jgi:ankyrin repeat protein
VGANPDMPDCFGATPLFAACQQGHLEVVRFLLSLNSSSAAAAVVVDVSARTVEGLTPFFAACDRGHESVARLLGGSGGGGSDCGVASVDTRCRTLRGWTPLHGASCRGHEPVVRYLLEECPLRYTTADRGTRLQALRIT